MKAAYKINWIILTILTVLTVPAWADTIYVDVDATGSESGNDWTNAYNDIESAVDVASANDEIWVAEGTYTLSEEIDVDLVVKIYGGFDGTETLESQRDWRNNVTTVDGDGSQCFVVTASAEINGFTVTGSTGTAIEIENAPLPDPPAPRIVVASTIRNCIITSNGRGVRCSVDTDTTTLENCVFYANEISDSGAGVYCSTGSNGNVNVRNCVFAYNSASGTGNSGGAVLAKRTSSAGGADLKFYNCTFYGNEAADRGGAIAAAYPGGYLDFYNCILSSDTTPNLGKEVYGVGAFGGPSTIITFHRSYIDTSDAWYTEGGNTSYVTTYTELDSGDNPLYNTLDDEDEITFYDEEDPANDGLRLTSSYEGCIDKGDNSYVTLTSDIAGNARRINSLGVSDGGSGTAPIVDMGAYEFVESGGPIYVDTAVNSTNATGQSWANPFDDIQSAIDAASAGDEIWVADGTYTLASQINANVAADIYGGFQGNSRTGGGETLLTQRNYSTYTTTISGNNTYRCLNVSADATIDGFTIQNGSASDGAGLYITNSATVTNCTITSNSASDDGAGIFTTTGSPTISNCTISYNTATDDGGGIYAYSGSPTVSNCTFTGNDAASGAGLYIPSSPGSTTVTECSLNNNDATSEGGGIYVADGSSSITDTDIQESDAQYGAAIFLSASPQVTGCYFEDNYASIDGGGIYSDSSASSDITGCTFDGCEAVNDGGAIYYEYDSGVNLDDCIFVYNAAENGGAIYTDEDPDDYLITRCVFVNNTADDYGGAIYNTGHSAYYTDIFSCVFAKNDALAYDGGAIYNDSCDEVNIINCTFYQNTADDNGGAICNNGSTVDIANCILWDDSASGSGDEIYNSSSTVDLTYSCIDGSGGGGTNTDQDPDFTNVSDLDGSDGDWGTRYDGLIPTSTYVIDQGNNNVVDFEYDVKDDSRIYNTVDMGAYEDWPEP